MLEDAEISIANFDEIWEKIEADGIYYRLIVEG